MVRFALETVFQLTVMVFQTESSKKKLVQGGLPFSSPSLRNSPLGDHISRPTLSRR